VYPARVLCAKAIRLEPFVKGLEYFFDAISPLQAIKKPFDDPLAFKGLFYCLP
jgi:hypothetical protein